MRASERKKKYKMEREKKNGNIFTYCEPGYLKIQSHTRLRDIETDSRHLTQHFAVHTIHFIYQYIYLNPLEMHAKEIKACINI